MAGKQEIEFPSFFPGLRMRTTEGGQDNSVCEKHSRGLPVNAGKGDLEYRAPWHPSRCTRSGVGGQGWVWGWLPLYSHLWGVVLTILEQEDEVTVIRTYHWEGLLVLKFRLSLLFPMQEKFVKIRTCPPTVFSRGRFLRRAWNKKYIRRRGKPTRMGEGRR